MRELLKIAMHSPPHSAPGREGLKKAALYMTKPDYYVKLLVPGNDRTFWKTNMFEPRTDKRGRPRTKTWTQPRMMSMPLNPSGDALL